MASGTPSLLLQTLRTRYGLSQAQLAEYLSVSRAQVSMAEQGKRTLTAAAWAKLQPLTDLLSSPTPSPAAVTTSLDTASREALQHRLRECSRQAAQLRQELAQLRAQAAQHQAVVLELLPLLSPQTLATEATTDQAWLKARETEATEELKRSGPAAQILLELRIEALEYEAGQAALRLARATDLPM